MGTLRHDSSIFFIPIMSYEKFLDIFYSVERFA